jgi:hypothetical protein
MFWDTTVSIQHTFGSQGQIEKSRDSPKQEYPENGQSILLTEKFSEYPSSIRA